MSGESLCVILFVIVFLLGERTFLIHLIANVVGLYVLQSTFV